MNIEYKLCPVCNTRYTEIGNSMCNSCHDSKLGKLERANERLTQERSRLENQRDYQYDQACKYSRQAEQAEGEQKRLLNIISEIRQLTRLAKDKTDIGTAVRRLYLIWDKCDEAEGKS